MLRRRARDVVIAAPELPATIVRRGSRRKVRNTVLACGATLTIGALAAGAVDAMLGPERDAGSTRGGPPGARTWTPPLTGGHLRLVDYALRAPRRGARAATGPTITLAELRRHASCMRSLGFAVPAPTAQPGGGWSVIVDDPDRRGLGFGSRAFRKAWFVTCGPLGGPLSGDMVISGPRHQIDRFTTCMSRHGFELLEPRRDATGHYDIDQWKFDLTGTGIDMGSRAWNQAMFVDCAPQGQ
jgi:hypothetical protein